MAYKDKFLTRMIDVYKTASDLDQPLIKSTKIEGQDCYIVFQ